MSFRKRNVVIGSSGASTPIARQEKSLAPGTRPSPLDGRLTTSTGTQSLDQLLAGHAGMPMGTSLLVEEAGTTDFGGVLLRYYAAEGLVQGHHVHLLGFGDGWRRELPGIGKQGNSKNSKITSSTDEKMKIAWRYETLGQRSVPARDHKASLGPGQGTASFCHTFDLSKRLESNAIKGQFHASPIDGPLASPSQAPFKRFIADVISKVKSSSPSTVHRIIVPSLLSPTLYNSAASQPREVLQFLHALRALLRQFPTQTTALLTLPITLFQRSSGLTRWMELLSDGVLELIPLQHQGPVTREPGGENKGQGMLRAHSLPVFHEKGGGIEGTWARENLSFRLSSSSGLVIEPFSLPPDTMATPTAPSPVRISKIAGRFLIFDADSATLLRRNENVNGTLTGTAPQQPTQNIFLGLPVELRPEEAETLVSRRVAYLVDDVAAHQSVLRNPDPDARKAYLDSLKTRKQTAQRVFAEQNAKRAAEIAERHGAPASRSKKPPPTNADDDALLSSNPSESSSRQQDGAAKSLGVTPTSSSCLISQETARMFRADKPAEGPLCRFLLSSGYYMTPGLRFGAKYSVYPGDPLRFHAHFMASQYDWDEEIPILDIVAGGRLATAVKKAFLIGGQEPWSEASSDRQVRTFSLEWAAM
ncbi:PAXNEB protein-domain-containing protein [Dactylonectria estremocensis]|uniref:Elongator complex protein 4 n=1 Tax=Dactylonectria estremocensis TaxID=1079267 RepID=A0A9P9JJ78_9HYPO|nr:PAXNEB protein-domain-containing protein [Dactylonectria estremocensis]